MSHSMLIKNARNQSILKSQKREYTKAGTLDAPEFEDEALNQDFLEDSVIPVNPEDYSLADSDSQNIGNLNEYYQDDYETKEEEQEHDEDASQFSRLMDRLAQLDLSMVHRKIEEQKRLHKETVSLEDEEDDGEEEETVEDGTVSVSHLLLLGLEFSLQWMI